MDRGAWGLKSMGVADRHSSATNTFYFLEGTMQEFSAPQFSRYVTVGDARGKKSTSEQLTLRFNT